MSSLCAPLGYNGLEGCVSFVDMTGKRLLRSRFFGLLCPFTLLIVGSAMTRWWPPFVSIGLLIFAGGVLFLHISCRASEDSKLMWIVGASYLLRSAIAVFLFVASAYRLPVLPSLQLEEGFWRFARDALSYHAHALNLLDNGLKTGWIDGYFAVDLFSGLLAWSYWLFVPHPLVGIILNIWAATGMALLAFAIGKQFEKSTARGLLSALFVAFWPSTLIWSSQLLRDTLSLFFLFLTFSLILRIMSERNLTSLRTMLSLVTTYVVVFLLAKLRPQFAWVLLASCSVVWPLIFLYPRLHRWTISVCCFAVIALGILVGVSRPFWLPLPSVLISKALNVSPPIYRQVEVAPTTFSTMALRQAPFGEQDPSQFRFSSFPTITLVELDLMRKSYAQWGGNMIHPDADISTLKTFIFQLPDTIVAAIFSPYPWRLSLRGSTGVFRIFAAVEVFLLVLLLPVLFVGGVGVGRMKSFVGCCMLTYGLLVWFLVALIIPNEGAIFRLRLQGVLLVLVAAIGGGGLRIYSRFWRRLWPSSTYLR